MVIWFDEVKGDCAQVESVLEDARIKLATVVSDLLGVSSRRMLEALRMGRSIQLH